MYMSLTVGMQALLAPTDKHPNVEHSCWMRTILKLWTLPFLGKRVSWHYTCCHREVFLREEKERKYRILLIEGQKSENHGELGTNLFILN